MNEYYTTLSKKLIKFNITEGKNNKYDTPIIFSHGYRAEPKVYSKLLENLSEKGYTSIGINRFNMNNRPESLDEHLELTGDFINKLNIDKYHKIGHSLGGYITMKLSEVDYRSDKLIAINPAIEVDYGLIGFIGRSLQICKNDLIAFFSDKIKDNQHQDKAYESYMDFILTASGFMNKLVTTPIDTINILSEISNGDFIYPMNKGKDLTVIQSLNDEFFDIQTKDLAKWKYYFNECDVKWVKKGTHNFPMIKPNHCTKLILDTLEENVRENTI